MTMLQGKVRAVTDVLPSTIRCTATKAKHNSKFQISFSNGLPGHQSRIQGLLVSAELHFSVARKKNNKEDSSESITC